MFIKVVPTSLLFIAGVLTSSFFFSSCGSSEEGGGTEDFEVTTDTIPSEARVNFDLVRINIPRPWELTSKLTKAKINYNKGFLLSSGKANSFSSNYQKAIGAGALGADIYISASYNQSQDAIDNLNTIGKIATDLGISAAFDTEFLKELLSSVGKQDTFQIMLDKAFDKAEKNLRSNQRVATAVLMVAGGWIESLHVTVEGLNTNPSGEHTKPVYESISNHTRAFDYIFQLLDAYKSNPDCAKLIQEMAPSKPMLMSIGNNFKLGAADLPQIRETVAALRNKIIS